MTHTRTHTHTHTHIQEWEMPPINMSYRERCHPSICHTSICHTHTGMKDATHQYRRPIWCLIVIGHFPQKSPTISRSLAENNLQRNTFYGSSPPFITCQYVILMGDISAVCCSVLQCVAVCCSVLQCVKWRMNTSRINSSRIDVSRVSSQYVPYAFAISVASASHTPYHLCILIGDIPHSYVSWLTNIRCECECECVCVWESVYVPECVCGGRWYLSFLCVMTHKYQIKRKSGLRRILFQMSDGARRDYRLLRETTLCVCERV